MFELRSYQEAPARELLECVKNFNVSVDGSDMGTGKTYVNAWIAAKTGLPVFVVCPKVVITPWKKVLKEAGADVIDVVNYEKLTRGTHAAVGRDGQTLTWNLPKNTLIIFDEAQRLTGWDYEKGTTLNGQLLLATMNRPDIRVILASGTLADEPQKLYAIGQALGLHNGGSSFIKFCEAHGCRMNIFNDLEYRTTSNGVLAIRKKIFPNRGIRISKMDLGDEFPTRTVDVHSIPFSEEHKAIWDTLEDELKELAKKVETDYDDSRVAILRARQEAELLKVPHLVELTINALNNGERVPLFVNFQPTLDELANQFQTTCIVDGRTKAKDRDQNIEAFQENEEPVILVNLQAGGVGLSLHDLVGGFPRHSFICPTFSANNLAQAVDRTHRNGALSPSHSTIVFFDYGIERRICAKVQRKLNDLSKLNDGELQAAYKVTADRAKKLAEDEKPFNVGLKFDNFFKRR